MIRQQIALGDHESGLLDTLPPPELRSLVANTARSASPLRNIGLYADHSYVTAVRQACWRGALRCACSSILGFNKRNDGNKSLRESIFNGTNGPNF